MGLRDLVLILGDKLDGILSPDFEIKHSYKTDDRGRKYLAQRTKIHKPTGKPLWEKMYAPGDLKPYAEWYR